MPTYSYIAFAPNAFTFPNGGGFTNGNQFQLDPGWDATNDGYGFAITDDDTDFGGDFGNRDDGGGSANEIGADSGQSAVITDPAGATVSSGRVYLDTGHTFVDETGATITLYEVEIGGTLVGYIADGPIQPGNTYTVTGITNPGQTASFSVAYGDLHSETYDADIANTVQGTDNNDTLNGGAGNDTVQAGAGDDSIDGGAGNDTLDGGTGDDTISGGLGADELSGGVDADTFIVEDSYGADTITGGETGVDIDTIDLQALSNSFAISFTGGGAGTITDGTAIAIFSEIEQFVLPNGETVAAGQAGDQLIYDSPTGTSFSGGSGNDTLYGNDGDDDFWGGGGDDLLDGGAGNDSLGGGAGADIISGGAGNDGIGGDAGADTISGGAGDDGIGGGEGNDLIFGEAGNDGIGGDAGDDTIAGGSGNDGLGGGSGNDLVSGGDGDDGLSGDAGNDTVHGDAGSDTLVSSTGNDAVFGGDDADQFLIFDGFGSDTLTGGEGITTGNDRDTLDFSSLTNGVNITYSSSEAGTVTDGADTLSFSQIEALELTDLADSVDAGLSAQGVTIDGADGNDTLTGGNGDDSITGGQGWDRLRGGDGADTIDGGAQRDFIYGGTGDDSLVGGGASGIGDYYYLASAYGNDTIVDADNAGRIDSRTEDVTSNLTVNFGTNYNGTLSGVEGTVTFQGLQTVLTGTGNDVLNASAMTADVYLYAGDGNNIVIGGAGNDDLRGGLGDDSLVGGAGNDYFETRGGNDTVIGGDGNDQLNAFGGDPGDTVSYDAGAGEDSLFGSVQNFDADLGSGNDYAETGGGSDTINTGGGSDVIFTEDDADLIEIEDGFNGSQIYGGEGVTTGIDRDTLDAGALTAAVNIVHTTSESGTLMSGTDGLSFEAIEEIGLTAQGDSVDASTLSDGVSYDGLEGDDTLIGGAGADTLAGGDGDDLIEGGAGDDFLTTGLGQDTLLGGSGNDTLMNSDGDDSLDGGSGDDSIVATGGEDTLRGGTGADFMDGGDDADTFIIEDNFGNDTIIGGEGTTDPGDEDFDTIDISALSGPVTVSYTGDEAGTITDGTDTITFSEIERIILTEQADLADASADSVGVEIDALGGDDTVTGGTGNDTLLGGGGEDLISGGAGDDSINSGFSNDTVFGGAGNDTIVSGNTGSAQEQFFGGAGNDSIIGGTGADLLDGGDDSDTLRGGDGNDTLLGGDGSDVLVGRAGNDSLVGGTGADVLDGGNDADTLQGGDGDDLLLGAAGSDLLVAGAGNDSLTGGSGDDNLTGGTGDDTLTGGAGNDTFVYNVGDGSDTITDFNSGNTGTLDDGDSTNNDSIDLSSFYDDIWELHADQADDGVLNQSNATDNGGDVDYSDNSRFASGEGITFQGASADNSSFTSENTGVACFASGTLVLTARGDVPIEQLCRGDLVQTRDNGMQPILWVGSHRLSGHELAANPKLRPISISPLLSGGDKQLIVSPQHAVMLRVEGVNETLVRAAHLARMKGGQARVMQGCRNIHYFHVMFEAHQIIFANGAPTESFYPGPQAFGALSPAARTEIKTLLPGFRVARAPDHYGLTIRDISPFRSLPPHLKALEPTPF